jgi:hypothetical protein
LRIGHEDCLDLRLNAYLLTATLGPVVQAVTQALSKLPCKNHLAHLVEPNGPA